MRSVCTNNISGDYRLSTFEFDLSHTSFELREADDLLGPNDIDTQLLQVGSEDFLGLMLRYYQRALEGAWDGAKVDLNENSISISNCSNFRRVSDLHQSLGTSYRVQELEEIRSSLSKRSD
jgi:hypothetical protein